MAPIAPMWWFKEVPVHTETFVDIAHSVTHVVPLPRNFQTQRATDVSSNKRHLENQAGVFAFPSQFAKSIVWRTKENATILELISLSGKENSPTRQISFQFHASILPGIHFAPLTQHGGISIALMTVDCVLYRLHISALSRFLTKDMEEGYSSAAQVKWTANCEPLLFRYIGDRQAAVAATDGRLFLVQTALLAEDANRHEHAEVKVYDLQEDTHFIHNVHQGSAIQKLYSRFQSAFDSSLYAPARDMTARINIVAIETYTTHDDNLLFALYQDRTIGIWSIARRQCLQTMRTPASPNASGYVQETIDESLRAHLRIISNPHMPWALRLLVYVPTETEAQMSIYSARLDTSEDVKFVPGSTCTIRPDSTVAAGSSTSDLVAIDIKPNESQTGYTIWGLWETDMRMSVKYMLVEDHTVEPSQFCEFAERSVLDGRWWSVAMQRPPNGFIKSMGSVDDSNEGTPKYFADYVFTSGRFSDRTIMRALEVIFKGRSFILNSDLRDHIMDALSVQTPSGASKAELEQARKSEIMGWTKFISTCVKIDYDASVPLGLSIASDTGYMVVVKQDSLSFLTACDDSEILFHTFQDKQFEVARFLATPPSQLRSTYPKIQDHALRQDVSKLFMAMDFVTRNIVDKDTNALECVIAHLSTTNGPRDFIDILSREHLPRYVSVAEMNRARNLVASCSRGLDVFIYMIRQMLYNADSNPSVLTSSRCILPYEALVAASVQQLAIHRYVIAQNFLILAVVIFSGPPSPRTWIDDESRFISDAMRSTQALLVLKWVSCQSISSPLSTSVSLGLEQQLSQMHVQDGTDGTMRGRCRQTLTGSLLKTMASESGRYGAVEFPIYLAIPRAASKFLHQLGILNQSADESETKYHTGLAQRLSGLGEMTLLSEFLKIVPQSACLAYYRGKVLLSQGRSSQALEQFLTVSASFGNDLKISNVEQELDIMRLDYRTRVSEGHSGLENYYSHVISLFAENGAHEQVIHLAKLALTELLNDAGAQVVEEQIRGYLEPIYTSALAIRSYEQAYIALMQVTSETLRKQYLRVFVATVCANGDGAKLCLHPFTGVREEVERMLVHSAEHAPVLSSPDPYKILYAYYCYHGEFRNAASVMCQYGQKLTATSNQTESVLALLTEAGHAYLAAINALHMAGLDSSWVTVQVLNQDFQKVIQLTEIKMEYALIMAKLKLVKTIPELVTSAALAMSEQETMSMLVLQGDYEGATSLALLFNMDLSIVFNSLADKYLTALKLEQEELHGKNGLQGAKSVRVDNRRSVHALLTLEAYLERHDKAETNFKYRLGVIERMLQRNPHFDLPPWLINHFLTHNPEDLIRLYLKAGALNAAAEFSSVIIQQAMPKDNLISRHPNARWLPYSLLDEIFASLQTQIEDIENVQKGEQNVDSSSGSRRMTSESLRELKNLKTILEVNVRLYLENVERESIFNGKK
ncbi:hypothetical protein BGZ50_006870 [Haplosporangium sp. Z 11]|nr:hypothetical protein BGZ50_006870 [Haplosporangium sp. Z 11]